MKLPLYWVDAFTSEVFAGNPAAVVPLESWLPDPTLQKIAFENGLSETAFVVRTGPGSFGLRWFTPRVEVDLCGHATLATAHVLFERLAQQGACVTFETASGLLMVKRRDNRLELDFPVRPALPAPPTPELAAALPPSVEYVGKSSNAWLCVVPHARDVVAYKPDPVILAALRPGRLILTAPGEGCDYVARYFAPDAGVLEDPATGSSHCTLTPYWAARLGRDVLHARQSSERGGQFWCTLKGDRVLISGHCALYLEGHVTL